MSPGQAQKGGREGDRANPEKRGRKEQRQRWGTREEEGPRNRGRTPSLHPPECGREASLEPRAGAAGRVSLGFAEGPNRLQEAGGP